MTVTTINQVLPWFCWSAVSISCIDLYKINIKFIFLFLFLWKICMCLPSRRRKLKIWRKKTKCNLVIPSVYLLRSANVPHKDRIIHSVYIIYVFSPNIHYHSPMFLIICNQTHSAKRRRQKNWQHHWVQLKINHIFVTKLLFVPIADTSVWFLDVVLNDAILDGCSTVVDGIGYLWVGVGGRYI